jgi:hypothetical protein
MGPSEKASDTVPERRGWYYGGISIGELLNDFGHIVGHLLQ